MAKCWRVAESWESTTDTTMSLTVGDIIVVVESEGEWWYGYPEKKKPGNESNLDGISGYFPANYIEEVLRPAAPPAKFAPPPAKIAPPPAKIAIVLPPPAPAKMGVPPPPVRVIVPPPAPPRPTIVPVVAPEPAQPPLPPTPTPVVARAAPPPARFRGPPSPVVIPQAPPAAVVIPPAPVFAPKAPDGPLPTRVPPGAPGGPVVPRPPGGPRPPGAPPVPVRDNGSPVPSRPTIAPSTPPQAPTQSAYAAITGANIPAVTVSATTAAAVPAFNPSEATKIRDLLNEFDADGGMPPLKPHNKLILSGFLNKKCSMKIQVRHFWLWDDQFFYAKDVEDYCTAQGQLGKKWQLKRVHALDKDFDVVRLPSKGGFKILSNEKPLVLFADENVAREIWVNALLVEMKRLNIPTQTTISVSATEKKENDIGIVLPTGPIADWDMKQVGNWLKLKGYANMEAAFKEKSITGSVMMGMDDRYLKDNLGVADEKMRERFLRDLGNVVSNKRPQAGVITPSRAPTRIAAGANARASPSVGLGATTNGASTNGFNEHGGPIKSTGPIPVRPRGIPPQALHAAPTPGAGRLPARPGSAPPAPLIDPVADGEDEAWDDDAMGVPPVAGPGGTPPPRPPPRNSFCRRYAANGTTTTVPPAANPPRAPLHPGAARPLAMGGGFTPQAPRRAPVPGQSSIRHSSSADEISTMGAGSTGSSGSAASWDVEQVCSWLKELNLDKYDAAFRREQVDGSVLMALTDKMLEEDFSMSGLHRTRFLLKLSQLSK